MPESQSVTLEDFSGGLATDAPPYKLLPGEFRELNNLFLTAGGQLKLRKGQTSLLDFTAASGGPIALTRYRDNSPPSGVSGSWIVYAGPTTGHVRAKDESGATIATLDFGGGLKSGSRFALMQRRVFWATASGAMRMWDGEDYAGPSESLALGAVAPTTAPTASNNGAGLLDTTGRLPVRYYMTFKYIDGRESNPSPVSNGISGVNFEVLLNSLPTTSETGATRPVYRAGGKLPSARLVGTVPDGDTTTIFTDNMPDIEALDQPSLSFAHDAPPEDVIFILTHKQRMIALSLDDVYISSLAAPWYFPIIYTDPETDGKRFTLDADSTNPNIAACSIGAAVFILRRNDCYILHGEDIDSWVVGKIADVGGIAPLSLVSCNGIPAWLGPDRMVWMLPTNTPQPVALKIEKSLTAVSQANAAAACACYHRNQYHICIPNRGDGTSLYLVYDFRVNNWTDLSQEYARARYLYAKNGVSDTDTILLSTYPGFVTPAGVAYGGIVNFLDTSTPSLDFALWSADFDGGPQYREWDKQMERGRITGRYVPASGDSATLTVYTEKEYRDGRVVRSSKSYPLQTHSGEGGSLFDGDLAASLVGHRFSYRLSGTAKEFELHGVEFAYIPNRRGRY